MLEKLFSPKSVAIVGASTHEGKIGHILVQNLLKYKYKGKIFPINPKADEILGLKVYPSLEKIPEPVDLVIIAVKPEAVLETIKVCGQKNIQAAVVISAGFKETGPQGARLEEELKRLAQENGVRLLGPNCVGLIDTNSRLNASFATGMPERGNIGFFSQSGAMCIAVLDWALGEKIGFSKFVSLGNKADISEIDMLLALGEDETTKVILGYLEGVEDGHTFIQVAQEVSKKKPIILIKAGVTSAGAKAVSSHTGSLAGSESAYQAAFKQSGIIRAHTVTELFNYAFSFAVQPLPKGPRLAILTNSGGPGIVAADACDQSSLQLVRLQARTVEKLRSFLPPMASFFNPIDILGDAHVDRYDKALEILTQDDNIDAILVLLTPTATIEVKETAEVIVKHAKEADKPIICSFMGKVQVEKGVKYLKKHGIPNYLCPEDAVDALEKMWQRKHWLSQPLPEYPQIAADRSRVRYLLEMAKREGRFHLSETDAKEVLKAYGFALPQTHLARTREEAVEAAKKIGFPVVLKIVSPDISHKTDVGGVILNLNSPPAVKEAFSEVMLKVKSKNPRASIYGVSVQEMVQGAKETIIGFTRDPQFGPLLMFGLGGIYVEILKDVTFRIAPLTKKEAMEMVREVKAYSLLRGIRGEPPADVPALVDALLALSQLALDFPEIVEAEINPLLVKPAGQGIVAVDARLSIKKE
ncbi:MAG: acetate--CoA ligase family protein [Candidatus Desulfofervidaceae bacterium]|nr:acetate--CoA ligase family protein [Candidatus Desulfofervidaceae bacterium]